MKKTIWMTTAMLSLVGWAGAVNAQQYAEADIDQQQPIVVTATRTAQNPDNVPATVSVITDQDIEANMVGDIKDLVRFEPGVSVQTEPARFNAALSPTGRAGNAGFNIRGLDGNRVLIVIDGVRVPDAYDFNAISFGRGDYVDLDLLQSVEILRGPASALYGSDGLAGAVSFTTRDPSSFLGADETFAGRARVGYSSADRSTTESLIGAARSGAWSALLAYTRRDGEETDNRGDNNVLGSLRTTPNPQDWNSNSALGRVVFEPSAQNRFRLTTEYADRDVSTDVLSARSATTLSLLADDTSQRERISFDHTFTNDGGFIDRAFWNVFYQTSKAVEFTAEDRTSTDRTRHTSYSNDVYGGGLQLDSAFESGSVDQHFTYGFDLSRTRQEAVRSGINPTFPETFPVRPFPNTDWTLAGAYVQDEITLLNGQLRLFPALRYDYYEIDPQADAIYPIAVEEQNDSHVTPKFGVVVWPTDNFGAFFNYAGGFKSPSPRQVNEYFQNSFGPWYQVLPNPDLKPETSNSVEIGARLRNIDEGGAVWSGQISVYTAWYDNFIDQTIVGGSLTSLDPIDPTQFQWVNLGEVNISGIEARIDGQWENGFGLTMSAAYSEGDATTDDPIFGRSRAPLNSIDPFKLVTGLTYNSPGARYGGQVIATYVADKDTHDIDGASLPTASFTLLDLTAYWNITDAATIRAGIFNLTDERYIWWSDARNLAATSPIVDAYTQPGRNFTVSIGYRF